MQRFFLEAPVQMSEAVNRDQFLISDAIRVGVIAQMLKTSVAPPIVEYADKRIESNELEYVFHLSTGQKIDQALPRGQIKIRKIDEHAA